MGMIFVWVFVLIAGGLFITLFFFLSTSIGDNAKAGLAFDALQQVETILATQQASTDTYAPIPIPHEQLILTCESIRTGGVVTDVISELRIGGIPQDHEYRLLVGRSMETDNLLVFSKQAMLPFAIGNILYVSNEQEILLLSTDTLQPDVYEFREYLPQPIRDRAPTTSSANYDAATSTVRSVFFSETGATNSPANINFNRPRTAENGIYIEVVGEDPLTEGYVRYWRYQGNELFAPESGRFYYSGLPMLLAYIWMGDEAHALCFSHKLSTRLMHITDIHIERFGLLSQHTDTTPTCEARYVTPWLINLKDAAQLTQTDIFEDLPGAVNRVRLQNEALTRGDRCALIY